ncbi:MAG: hypothetical protein JWO36_7299 [Myxococcales bacterium]|nr:hypothetical protein [Myxococcales bacterium]
MARPPTDDPMTERLEVRLTAKHKAKLLRAAKRAGLDLGSWIRFVALREADLDT